MFEKASRLKLRFDYRGQCSVEDLWDLPVEELDTIFKRLNSQLKAQDEESLLDKRTTADTIVALKVGIIKHIVTTKLEEQAARENRAIAADRKRKLLSIIAEKQDAELYNLPLEELNKLADDIE